MKVDVHTHILPREWPDLSERYGYEGFVRLHHLDHCSAAMMVGDKMFRQIGHNTWDPEQRIAEMEEANVDVQVLSTVPVMFGYWARPEHTLDLCKILNDHIASVVNEHPRRFIGLCTLPMQEPDLAARELERCVKELGLAGVEIGTHINSWNLNAPELFNFFQAADELDASIFVHPWDMMGRDEVPQYWLPWLVGMPAESSRAICSLIFGGVLERLPNLKFLFAHGGGAFPATIGRINHAFHVRPDLCAVDNDVSPRNYLGKFYIDSIVHEPEMMRYLLKIIGPEKIALGSDYPFVLGELTPGAMIESMEDITLDIREKIFSSTPLEFLGIKKEALVR
ncbi:MAG TPA: amidohydrolase family protein [bacterium]|jgi:aminocarboxymuconate-semialdehyde decarboxylase